MIVSESPPASDVDVGKDAGQVDDGRQGVFLNADVRQRIRHGRRIIDRRDGDRHLGEIRVFGAVGRPIGEAVLAVPIGGRLIGERAVGQQRQRAMLGRFHLDRRKHLAAAVVVAQDPRGRNLKRAVLGDLVGVGRRNQRVADRRNRDRDRGRVRGGALVVGDLIREAVAPVEALRRRVGDRAIDVGHRRAVGRICDDRDAADVQRLIAVHVGVVGQHVDHRRARPRRCPPCRRWPPGRR